MIPRLIILEGPDGGGKTTLARGLADRLGYEIHEHGPYSGEQEIAFHYDDSITRARGGPGVVMDRSWLSEPIYGRARSGGACRVSGVERRVLERRALSLHAIVIVVRPSLDTCVKTWAARRDVEYLRELDQLSSVWEEYGESWQEELILPSVLYDRDRDMNFVDVGIQLLDEWGWDGVPGRPAHGLTDPGLDLIVVDHDNRDAFGHLVPPSVGLSALEEREVRECELQWVGAHRAIAAIGELAPGRIFALGRAADSSLRDVGCDYDYVPRPGLLGTALRGG